jgi:transcription elongation GreA/GreB family factor
MWSGKQLMALKVKVHQNCEQVLADKLKLISDDLESLQQAQQNETKSSMGDKYETGPAMLNQQRQRLLQQQQQLNANMRALGQLNPRATTEMVQLGTLLATDQGLFYLAIGLGAIECEDHQVWVISLQSPLGQALNAHKPDQTINFQGRTYRLLQLT